MNAHHPEPARTHSSTGAPTTARAVSPSGHDRCPRWLTRCALGLSLAVLAACTAPLPATPQAASPRTAPEDLAQPATPAVVAAWPAADVWLLGEQHDAPDHHHRHREVVQWLASQHRLAALVLEMADVGQDTRALSRHASEHAVRAALAWPESAWPWASYGPAVMAAVRAGVPVLGGNLPRARNAETLGDATWDQRVPSSALARQREAVRDSHCGLLPAGREVGMTRIQLARDARMADTVVSVLRPGQTVLLLTGSQHAHKSLGVPLHLPATAQVFSVRLDASGPRPDDASGFDAVWPSPPLPARDHCAEMRAQWNAPLPVR